MRIFHLVTVCLASVCFAWAQTPAVCMFTFQESGTVKKYSYTRTTNAPDANLFITGYVVTDNSSIPYRIFKITNNTAKRELSLLIIQAKTGLVEDEYNYTYSPFSGLLIKDGDDSVSNIKKPDLYLLSFENERKEYVFLHSLTHIADYSVFFSPVSDTLQKRNNELLKQNAFFRQEMQKQETIRAEEEKQKKIKEEEENRINALAEARVKKIVDSLSTLNARNETVKSHTQDDSLQMHIELFYQQYYKDSIAITEINQSINTEIHDRFYNVNDEDVLIISNGRFIGDTKSANMEGHGILIVDNRRVYVGTFIKNQFLAGKVNLKYELPLKEQYIGGWESARPEGLGCWFFANGDIELGHFGNGVLMHGIIRKTESNGNSYFGHTDILKKNGFGSYQTANTSKYIGIFANDILQNGYIIQVDDVGLRTYYRVKGAVKYETDKSTVLQFIKLAENIASKAGGRID